MSKNTQIRENYKYKKIFLKKKQPTLIQKEKTLKIMQRKKKKKDGAILQTMKLVFSVLTILEKKKKRKC